ncbi:MAG: trigger factor [Lachnospiraceae bacterium]|nr:trigger factor [Lachnospiraceae bacterium]
MGIQKNKKFMAALITLVAAGALMACGSTDTSGLKYLSDFKAKDFVKLGDYKGIEVQVEEPEITDDYLDGYIDYLLMNNPVSTPVTDRSVKMGDTANIDYEGKLDGVAFAGGTAQGFDLTIGSGRFIDGFEDGVVGMEIGETKDINLTFPDPYTNPDLAGKDVVFTVTVNSISLQEAPELNDEYVKSLGIEDCSTVEDYRNYIYDELMGQAKENFEEDKKDAVLEVVENNTVFDDMPEGMVGRLNDMLVRNMEAYAGMYDMDVGEYAANVYGCKPEEYEDVLLEQAERSARVYVMMSAIADKEKITVTDEEMEEILTGEAQQYGASLEEYTEGLDREGYREYLLFERVAEFLAENAVVNGQDSSK